MKIKELQRFVFSQLKPFFDGIETKAYTDMLLRHYTGYDAVALNLNPYVHIENIAISQINSAIEDLLKNKPIQYVLGETEFCGLRFKVNQSVLIPRQETEELVMWILEENPTAENVLDLCTGSGCIAVSIANKLKNANLAGVDISSEALSVARENATINHVSIAFSECNVLQPNFFINEKFDVIVSNPPYVREMEKRQMHVRVLDYEPQLSLFVEDNNPLLFYKAIARIGTTHLTNNGKLYLEINEVYGKEIADLLEQHDYKNIVLKKDIHGKDRMICGTYAIN